MLTASLPQLCPNARDDCQEYCLTHRNVCYTYSPHHKREDPFGWSHFECVGFGCAWSAFSRWARPLRIRHHSHTSSIRKPVVTQSGKCQEEVACRVALEQAILGASRGADPLRVVRVSRISARLRRGHRQLGCIVVMCNFLTAVRIQSDGYGRMGD